MRLKYLIAFLSVIQLVLGDFVIENTQGLPDKKSTPEWTRLMKNMTVQEIEEFMDAVDVQNILRNIVSNSANFKIPVSPACQKAGLKLIYPFKSIDLTNIYPILLTTNFGKLIDSWAKPTPRILVGGGKFWPGAYDECKAIDDTKFCASGFRLSMLQGGFGSCFPKDCNATDIDVMFAALNTVLQGKLVLLPGSMCEQPIKYESGAIITIIIFGVILSLCILGTCIELRSKSKSNSAIEGKSRDENIQKTKEETGSTFVSILLSFSLMRNTRAIMSTDVREGQITCINGVRVLSMTWVILGHTYFLLIVFSPDNILSLMEAGKSFAKEAILNATVSVDSFFLLSGLLVAYLTLKRIDSHGMGVKDFLLYLLHRYIRLTPSLGVVMLFYTNIFPMLFGGPTGQLPVTQDGLRKPCRDYWWPNLLYINNFYPIHMGDQCVGQVWYLANDMQFYVVAPLILLFMAYMDKRVSFGKWLNLIFILCLCAISLIITGILIKTNHLVVIGGAKDAKDTGNAQDQVYEKPYTRISPYLIGIYLGYLFSRKIIIHNKITGVIFGIAAAATGMAVVYGPYHVYSTTGFFSDLENLMYGVFARFAWGCSLAWVIYACHHKVSALFLPLGEYLNNFLSWKIWLPLSRLSYGAYLIHMMVMMVLYSNKVESGLHYQETVLAFDFVSVTAITFGCSYILTVCVDYPVQNLEKIMFKR